MSWYGRDGAGGDGSGSDGPAADAGAEGRSLDLRIVPAALTAWAVSAAGIVWHPGAAVVVGLGAVGSTWLAAWWGRALYSEGTHDRPIAAAVLALSLIHI